MLRAFISYPYRPETESFAAAVRSFLEPLQVEAVDGKWPDASIPLPKDIILKIKDCDVLISITFKDCPSPWADQEIGLAIGLGLDVIQITDRDIPRSGLIAEQFHISRGQGDFFVCTALAHTLNQMKQRRSADLGPALSSNAPLDELESEGWPTEILNSIFRLRALFAESQFESAFTGATLAFSKFPQCWRFLVAQSAALTHLNELDKAEKLLDDTIKQYSTKSRALSYAYDNKGWILSRRKAGGDKATLKARLRFHRQALGYEERVITYIHIVFCLLQLGMVSQAEHELANCLVRFPKSLESFKNQVNLQGKEFVQAIAKSHVLSALIFPRQG